jgi:uncharacterized protein (TIGR03437 family)
MRVMRTFVLTLAIAVCATAQVSPRNTGDSVQSIFDSGLAGSLLNADTVPASITSVTSASEFGGGFPKFAAGSWIEIKGSGLAETTRVWAGADFNGPNAPTALDNVRVTINSRPAFVYYISPTQLNVQAPGDPATGPVEVRITNPSGGTAATTTQKLPAVPGMLAPASFNVGGRQYMVAQFSDSVFVGRANLIAGAAFRPAKPGDNITAYGIGFGDVTPTIQPGVVVSQLNSVTLPLTLSFESTAATVSYKGLAPNFVGLYQFNITVPNVPPGDYRINMTLGGAPLEQPAMYLTVGN